MENEINALWNYTKKLEFLLVQSVKHNSRFKKNVKKKLKRICMALIEKGIKPDEMVKCINFPSNLSRSKQYDFSEDSDEDNEKEILRDERGIKERKSKQDGSDTESDLEMDFITKQREEDNILGGGSDLETFQKVQKFIERNNQMLKREEKYIEQDINARTKDLNGIINLNLFSGTGVNNEHGHFLNKKRKGADHSLD